MSWAIVKNNQVIEILNGAKAVTINGIQYPSTIFNLWTKADLKNIGIYPTQITSTIDNKTHKATGGVTYTINTDHVAVHYAKTPHNLTALKTKLVNEVDTLAKPAVLQLGIAALGLTSAFTIVLSPILSEVIVFVGSFVILVSAMR